MSRKHVTSRYLFKNELCPLESGGRNRCFIDIKEWIEYLQHLSRRSHHSPDQNTAAHPQPLRRPCLFCYDLFRPNAFRYICPFAAKLFLPSLSRMTWVCIQRNSLRPSPRKLRGWLSLCVRDSPLLKPELVRVIKRNAILPVYDMF